MAKRQATTKSTTNKASRKPRKASAAQKSQVKSVVEARKKRYQNALRVYQEGLESLQSQKYKAARTSFEDLINDYADERELVERALLYLRVCERELRPSQTVETFEHRLLAATMALNAGRPEEALEHLHEARTQQADSDKVEYLLSLAAAAQEDHQTAVAHLLRAIELNPDNRFPARSEQGFDFIREDEGIVEALEIPQDPDAEETQDPDAEETQDPNLHETME
tara:strand:- start:538 stop:1209 length:672 start_codon:yes stop_codon:yes gene_type:complete